jgi:radical SAM superfamily enzyme YgiQ (UPF0313 family)
MLKTLTIYFADLTHDSVGLATEVFPLNIGFVASYCKMHFGEAVEVKLFKYIPDLEKALYENPPDILALSNYPWCHRIDLAMFELLARTRPEALRFMGGPNFPHEPNLQRDFLASRPIIDSYAYLDGEVPFTNFIKYVFEVGTLAEAREELKERSIQGCCHINKQGQLVGGLTPIRLANLDEIPSPYLTGLLDSFFDGRLSPMIQTNRGCPFLCTFCSDGAKAVNKINQFSIERVKAELSYIGERVPKNVKSLFISDLNYGMYSRDAEISAEIARLREIYDYPCYIDTTTGKNSKRRVIANIEKLSGALTLTMSVQSLTPAVLKNIKRQNMRLDDFLGLKPAIERSGLPTTSEVILGLPGETKESHIETLSQLIGAGIDNVFSYTLMLLNGTELNTPEQRTMWGYKTKFRVIPRDFTRLRNGENIIEAEEVVIASNTLSFEDYIECRKFVLLIVLIHHLGFRAYMRFLLENKLLAKNVFLRILDTLNNVSQAVQQKVAPQKLSYYFREFERETREELWDSEKELIAFFQIKENFDGLIEGRFGANLLQTYKARIWAHAFEELVECIFAHTAALLYEADADSKVFEQLEQIERFCKAKTYNILGENRLQTVPETKLRYDIEAWISDPDLKPLSCFERSTERLVRFPLTRKQYQLVEDALDHFGHTDLGKGKVLIRIPLNALWRTPIYSESCFDPSVLQ